MRENRISGISQEIRIEVRDKHGRIKTVHREQREIATLLKRVIIKGPDGKIKEDTGLQPAHSFTINFLKILETYLRAYQIGIAAQYPTVQAYDVDHVLRNIVPVAASGGASRYYNMNLKALDDNDLYGTVVGTGTTAEGNTDYQLTTKIAHGTGAGQLDYGPQSFVEPYVNGIYCDLVLSRSFYNATVNSITAYEFGVYMKTYTNSASRYFCIIRDLEAGGKTVASGDTMVVQYTLRIGAGFTRTFFYALLSFFNDALYSRLKVDGIAVDIIQDTDGATVYGYAGWWLGANNQGNDDDFGLVIGSGTDAENFENYQLTTKIENTLITYLSQNWTTSQVVGANVDLVVSRSYYNDKAATVYIREVTLQSHRGPNAGAPGIALIRDLLVGAVQVDVGDTGTLQYTIRTNVAD